MISKQISMSIHALYDDYAIGNEWKRFMEDLSGFRTRIYDFWPFFKNIIHKKIMTQTLPLKHKIYNIVQKILV